jgi:hypothetical protein
MKTISSEIHTVFLMTCLNFSGKLENCCNANTKKALVELQPKIALE